ncbi:MAG: hypothetical protein GXW99_10955 [Clostridiales bacterium]|nr:hypothetical protein [Clostridiales bacterium]
MFKARKCMSWVQLLLGIAGTVLAVLALLHQVSWVYSIVLLGSTAVLAMLCLLYDFYRFRRGEDPYRDLKKE